MPTPPAPAEPAALRRWLAPRLLAWFAQHRRDLPWRHDRDPYRIWVSEVMLQQTQVATVIPYFERFLARFPTLVDLARAEPQEVLRLWEGLGYYRRARDLHRAAEQLVAAHGGCFPADPAALKGLPGFGDYTRNAVLSQAFDLRLPILEANSQRLLSRLFGREANPQESAARHWLWQAAEAVLPAHHVGDFNQALMELGALVCTPTAPRCTACPLAARCHACLTGRQEQIPARPTRLATVAVREAAVVVRAAGEAATPLLLVQRPASGRWAHLWEFPHGPLGDDEPAEAGAARLARELTGLEVRVGPEIVTLQHGVTRFAITVVCFEADHLSGVFRSAFYTAASWVEPAMLANYPVSAPQRRLAQLLTAPGRQRTLF